MTLPICRYEVNVVSEVSGIPEFNHFGLRGLFSGVVDPKTLLPATHPRKRLNYIYTYIRTYVHTYINTYVYPTTLKGSRRAVISPCL